MKTKLPESITSLSEAQEFLTGLINNNEVYHPEDDAHDIVWHSCIEPNTEELDKLNKLMDEAYSIEDFDPCDFILTYGGF